MVDEEGHERIRRATAEFLGSEKCAGLKNKVADYHVTVAYMPREKDGDLDRRLKVGVGVLLESSCVCAWMWAEDAAADSRRANSLGPFARSLFCRFIGGREDVCWSECLRCLFALARRSKRAPAT